MLVVMKREQFDSFERDQLGRACIEPVLHKVRGKNPEVKAQVYQQLSLGQRALFMFHVLHDHAHGSVTEFTCWIAHTLEEFSYWIGIQAGLRYFGQEGMLGLLDEMKLVLEERNQRLGKTMADVTPQDLEEDAGLFQTVSRIYTKYKEISPQTLQVIGTFIQGNPAEFVCFEEETA